MTVTQLVVNALRRLVDQLLYVCSNVCICVYKYEAVSVRVRSAASATGQQSIKTAMVHMDVSTK
jgi:hypothetical protein